MLRRRRITEPLNEVLPS